MKVCTICKKNKSLMSFYRHPHTKDGFGSQCKQCDTIEKRKIIKEKKKYLVDLLGGKCSKCGYNRSLQALDFHHKDNNKEFELSKNMKKKLSFLEKEAKKCILLCANCHREEHDLDMALSSTG